MRQQRRTYDWQRFDFAINQRALYILGAGASIPDIPSQIGNVRDVYGRTGFSKQANRKYFR
jgi:hypothetical protein